MRILLVGGNKGLGLDIKEQLCDEGHDVVAVSRTSTDFIPLDLRWGYEQIKESVKAAASELGGIDSLVVSSGMGAYNGPLVSEDKIKDMYQVNVFGPMSVHRASLKHLIKSQGKSCFITSCVYRRPGSGGLSIYAGTKGALNSWVISEGRRLAKKEIALFSVAPSFFESPMVADLEPSVREASTKAIPFGRFGTGEEIAKFTVNLLNQENWCLAGQIFECTGGA